MHSPLASFGCLVGTGLRLSSTLSAPFGRDFRDGRCCLQVAAPLASEIFRCVGSENIVEDDGVFEFIILELAMLA